MKKSSSPTRGVRSQVLKVPAYTLRAHEAEVKLNQNENPYDFPDDLKEEIYRRYKERSWARYPDFVPEDLRESLASFAGWKKAGVLVGNGSNELIQATLLVLVSNHTTVAIPTPTFTVYSLVSRILGGRIITIPLNEDLSYNIEDLITRAEEGGARLLIVCTPNNPTGTILEEEGLKAILDRFSGYVMLDEAYYEFCGHSGLKFLESHPRLIITRTFSKAMGMAGLRVGYLMAHPELVAEIAKAKLPYSVNQFSVTAAQVALDFRERFRPALDAILRERERLGAELSRIPGIQVYPTGANFFLFKMTNSPAEVFRDLYEQGVLVRDVSTFPMLAGCLRVSVGTPEENDRFLTALRGNAEKVSQPKSNA